MKNTNKNKEKETKKSSHFTYDDRVIIELLLSEKWSYSNIAKKLCKAKSSVFDEIRMNSVRGIYTAKKAHAKAKQRRRLAKLQAMKIPINKLLRDYVEEKIKIFSYSFN